MENLEKMMELERIGREIQTKPNRVRNQILANQKGINVYLSLIACRNPHASNSSALRLGGNLKEISYTYGDGTWHIFETDSGGRLWALSRDESDCIVCSSSEATFLSLPAENYGKNARVYLGFD